MTFSHADAGTAETEWLASGLAVIPELPLDTAELAAMTFIVLAAHPDDETLGAGGFLARLHAAGAGIEVLLCTAGEASHPGSRTTTPEQLAAVRLGEFEGALEKLVPGVRWQFLGLPDGQLSGYRSEIEARLRDAIEASGGPAGAGDDCGALPFRRTHGPRSPGIRGRRGGGNRRPRAAGISHLVLAVGRTGGRRLAVLGPRAVDAGRAEGQGRGHG